MLKSAEILLEGMVQGVGFRPFIQRLGVSCRLCGFVLNTGNGVEIVVEGKRQDILKFYKLVFEHSPVLVTIASRKITWLPAKGYKSFVIKESRKNKTDTAWISPDIAMCDECKAELTAKNDKRFLYPFINCTNCGPRFSIITHVPYDRPETTMKRFTMCKDCRKEYTDVSERRYHAQPVACAVCGPEVELVRWQGAEVCSIARKSPAISKVARLLKQGKIIGIKGLGGFHIAVDAANSEAVRRLRRRKKRLEKPFALMVGDIQHAKELCQFSGMEENILCSQESPILLLRKHAQNAVTQNVSGCNNYVGIMRAYTPLHYLLFAELSEGIGLKYLVMTSGNIADEPIEIDNHQAITKLRGVCDYFLLHNRPIYNRVDDSIVQVVDDKPVILRRSRGYSPLPLLVQHLKPGICALGAELKNSFCITKNKYAYVSQYSGDLKCLNTFLFYQQNIKRYFQLFDFKPKHIVCDLHPEYLSTRYAYTLERKYKTKLSFVQHHHAHVASVIAEHNITKDVIGVAFDGAGYGADGKIWGGEFFTGNLLAFKRRAHLEYMPMAGLDRAVEEPYRLTVGYLYQVFGRQMADLPLDFVRTHISYINKALPLINNNVIQTSSAGRLFDAVSSLLRICDVISYEAQAAIELEALAEKSESKDIYQFAVEKHPDCYIIQLLPVIRSIVSDLQQGVRKQDIARKFHNALAKIVSEICCLLRKETGINLAVLSGGVFQNKLFLEMCIKFLRKDGFLVYYNQLVPTNDGGICLGQAAIAAYR